MVRKKKLELPDDVRAFFAAASARRQRVDRPCDYCGELMRQVTTRRRYCSGVCHDRAAYLRRLDARRTPPPPPAEEK